MAEYDFKEKLAELEQVKFFRLQKFERYISISFPYSLIIYLTDLNSQVIAAASLLGLAALLNGLARANVLDQILFRAQRIHEVYPEADLGEFEHVLTEPASVVLSKPFALSRLTSELQKIRNLWKQVEATVAETNVDQLREAVKTDPLPVIDPSSVVSEQRSPETETAISPPFSAVKPIGSGLPLDGPPSSLHRSPRNPGTTVSF